jgi:hypothetical protein
MAKEIGISIPETEKAVRALRAFCDAWLGEETTTVSVGEVSMTTTAPPAPPAEEFTIPAPDHPPLPPVDEEPAGVPGGMAPYAPPETELDKRGVPWSADHHAATKTQKKDGSWKAKKGGDKEALKAYEAQYIGTPSAPPAPPAPPADDNEIGFDTVMRKATELTTNHNITPEGVQAIAQNVGLNGLHELATNKHLIPEVMAALEAVA